MRKLPPEIVSQKWCTYISLVIQTYCVFVLQLLNSKFLHSISRARLTPCVKTVTSMSHSSICTNILVNIFKFFLPKELKQKSALALTHVFWYRPFIKNGLYYTHKCHLVTSRKPLLQTFLDMTHQLYYLSFHMYIDKKLSHIVKRASIWNDLLYMYFGLASRLILFTPRQPLVERDITHVWFSLLFGSPNLFLRQTFGVYLNFLYFIFHNIIRKEFFSSN